MLFYTDSSPSLACWEELPLFAILLTVSSHFSFPAFVFLECFSTSFLRTTSFSVALSADLSVFSLSLTFFSGGTSSLLFFLVFPFFSVFYFMVFWVDLSVFLFLCGGSSAGYLSSEVVFLSNFSSLSESFVALSSSSVLQANTWYLRFFPWTELLLVLSVDPHLWSVPCPISSRFDSTLGL